METTNSHFCNAPLKDVIYEPLPKPYRPPYNICVVCGAKTHENRWCTYEHKLILEQHRAKILNEITIRKNLIDTEKEKRIKNLWNVKYE